MTKDEMKLLKVGDVVRRKATGMSYIVAANYGDRVTLVRAMEATNPNDWDLVKK